MMVTCIAYIQYTVCKDKKAVLVAAVGVGGGCYCWSGHGQDRNITGFSILVTVSGVYDIVYFSLCFDFVTMTAGGGGEGP
jgi:hypothetical protein